jgi:hypothetical protein
MMAILSVKDCWSSTNLVIKLQVFTVLFKEYTEYGQSWSHLRGYFLYLLRKAFCSKTSLTQGALMYLCVELNSSIGVPNISSRHETHKAGYEKDRNACHCRDLGFRHLWAAVFDNNSLEHIHQFEELSLITRKTFGSLAFFLIT